MDKIDLSTVNDVKTGMFVFVNFMIEHGAAHPHIPKLIDSIEERLQELGKDTLLHEHTGDEKSFRRLAEIALRLRQDADRKRDLDNQRKHPRVKPRETDDGLAF